MDAIVKILPNKRKVELDVSLTFGNHPTKADLGSYTLGFCQDLVAEAVRQCLGREYINFYAQQTFQFSPDCANVEKCRFWSGVNQNIEVTVLSVSSMDHRAENPGVQGVMALDDLDDRSAVTFEGCRGAHRQIMLRMRPTGKQGGWLCTTSHPQK